MNEIQIKNSGFRSLNIFASVLLFACLCGAVIYYYRNADGQLERELNKLEGLNVAIASETRQLQAGVTAHSDRIGKISDRVGVSKKRVQNICAEVAKSADDADRAIAIIGECEKIIEEVKTQK